MRVRAQIAVATVLGRAYYKLVSELKSKDIPFLSIVPGEPIPPSIRVVITTRGEVNLINHPQILVYDEATDPSNIINEALRIIMNKETYGELTIGVDPGKTFGIAILADGKILRREEGLSMERAIDLILSELGRNPAKSKKIRIGRGVPDLAEEVARKLEASLPHDAIAIEMVDEEGTSTMRDKGFKRKISDADSAIKIASKKGEARLRGAAQ